MSQTNVSQGDDRSLCQLCVGIVALCVGVVGMVGWLFHTRALVQLSPSMAPMQFNTALAFVLIGLALIAHFKAFRVVTFYGGLATLLIGALTLSEHIFSINLGIDQVFVVHDIITNTSYPGRMSPNGSLCFVLLGICCMIMARRRAWRFDGFALGVMGSTVMVISVVTLIGYLTKLQPAYGWGSFTHMSLQTAAACLFLGIGILDAARHISLAKDPDHQRWLPFFVSSSLFAAACLLWAAWKQDESDRMGPVTRRAAESVRREIQAQFETGLGAQLRMVRHWEKRPRLSQKDWEDDARSYVLSHPAYLSLSWTDMNYQIRWTVSKEAQGNTIRFAPDFEKNRLNAFDLACYSNEMVLSRPIDLRQGGRGFLAIAPIHAMGRFSGYVVGAFRFQSFFHSFLRESVPDFTIVVSDGEEDLYRREGPPLRAGDYLVTLPLRLSGVDWRVSVGTTPQALGNKAVDLGDVMLAFGSLLALLLGGVIRLAQMANKRAMELDHATQKLNIALDAAGMGVWDWDPVSGEMNWSVECERLFGLTPNTFRRHDTHFREIIHPDDVARVEQAVDRTLATGKEYDVEYRIVLPDGKFRWIQARGRAFFDANGNPTRMSGVAINVDARKVTEEKLRHGEFLLAEAQKIAHLGSWHMELPHRDSVWSAEMYRIFGLEPSDARVLPDFADHMIHPEDRHLSRRVFQDAIENGEQAEAQCRIIRPNGETRVVHLKIQVFSGENGRIKTLFGTCQDITEAKEAERELIVAREAALEASRLKSEFLANMSHEIRTPINGVIGMSALLMDASLPKEHQEYAENISRSADALLTVINDILDFSKIEAGKLELELIDFDILRLIDDVEKTMGFSARQKHLLFAVDVPLHIPCQFRGDLGRIRQILLNLVSNAIKFTTQGGVTLRVKELSTLGRESLLRFEVIDTGVGIAAPVLERLFLAFSQADSSTTRRFGGTGLGLSICKHLVGMMGGEIGVVSEEGKGSTFWFTLTLQRGLSRDGARELRDDQVLSEESSRLHGHILVVEDNIVNQKVAIAILSKLGYTADTADNGREALKALQNATYDLILMDCQMPEMDGYMATKAIRSSQTLPNPQIAIVAMTAHALKGDKERCLAAGMNDYVSKPVKPSELAAVLQRWLGSRGGANAARADGTKRGIHRRPGREDGGAIPSH